MMFAFGSAQADRAFGLQFWAGMLAAVVIYFVICGLVRLVRAIWARLLHRARVRRRMQKLMGH